MPVDYRPTKIARLVLAFSLFLSLHAYFLLKHKAEWYGSTTFSTRPLGPGIDELSRDADSQFDRLLSTQSLTVKTSVDAYRARRGRHPPPGFEKWFEFAQQKNSTIVEEFYDQIYHDLEPFWDIPPNRIRQEALTWSWVISIRNGSASIRNAESVRNIWLTHWFVMIREVASYLPDMDCAFNNNDEPRVIVPWEKINEYVQAAAKRKSINPSASGNSKPWKSQYQILRSLANASGPTSEPIEFGNTEPLWHQFKAACHPSSPARQSPIPFTEPPQFKLPASPFVQNVTLSRDICQNPQLANLHGAIISPRRTGAVQRLFPLFSGCKMYGNNDILVPAAMYRSNDPNWSGANLNGLSSAFDSIDWESKINGVVWRGQASGAASNAENWRHLHRHRFLSMLNGTQITITEKANKGEVSKELDSQNFPYPEKSIWPLSTLSRSSLGEWVSRLADGGFTHLVCDPWFWSQWSKGDNCSYLNPFFHVKDGMKMQDMYKYKFLPDIDGYSFSGRYRSFLRSNSLPIKGTLFQEWHDFRLTAWKHFVPMDNTYADWFGIMEYFTGHKKFDGDGKVLAVYKEDHDILAAKLAHEGQVWAEEVLRTEDMEIYMFRLLLEYGRVTNEDRDELAYVDDLQRQI